MIKIEFDDKGYTKFHRAALESDVVALQRMLDEDWDVDVRDRGGATALMHAANDPEALAFLIEHSADVNACDDEDYTALQFACINGEKDCVVLLLKEGARIDIENTMGLTATGLATMWNYVELREVISACAQAIAAQKVVDQSTSATPSDIRPL